MNNWHILTGEYPPQSGGVSDYTRLVAQGLAEAGDYVHVWTSPCLGETPQDAGVEVHRLPDHFGPRSLAVLHRSFNRATRPYRILVQYVPHVFGWKAVNLPFCIWLWSRGRRDSIWVMFHEVHFPLSRNQSAAHNLLGATTRWMASIVARAAERIFVSIPAWESILKQILSVKAPVAWLPVPSSIPVVHDVMSVAALRARYAPTHAGCIIGHFGTYPGHITEALKSLLPLLLKGHEERAALLLGRGSTSFRAELVDLYPELAGSVHASGMVTASDISLHLQTCDILVQPFVDGVSCRRTSVMAGLAHGLPIMTTNGPLSESLWAGSLAVVLAPVGDISAQAQVVGGLLTDEERRKSLSRAALKLYRECFDVRHTIAGLRGAEPSPLAQTP